MVFDQRVNEANALSLSKGKTNNMFQKLVYKLPLCSRWRLAVKTVPFVILILILEFIAYYFSYEFLTLNALFTAIISANIFLIGFLIYGSVFFISFVSFILLYMIFFIKDLDNPFGYTEEDSLVEEVSLKPVLGSQKRIEGYLKDLK